MYEEFEQLVLADDYTPRGAEPIELASGTAANAAAYAAKADADADAEAEAEAERLEREAERLEAMAATAEAEAERRRDLTPQDAATLAMAYRSLGAAALAGSLPQACLQDVEAEDDPCLLMFTWWVGAVWLFMYDESDTPYLREQVYEFNGKAVQVDIMLTLG